jgi:hypothetical protein
MRVCVCGVCACVCMCQRLASWRCSKRPQQRLQTHHPADAERAPHTVCSHAHAQAHNANMSHTHARCAPTPRTCMLSRSSSSRQGSSLPSAGSSPSLACAHSMFDTSRTLSLLSWRHSAAPCTAMNAWLGVYRIAARLYSSTARSGAVAPRSSCGLMDFSAPAACGGWRWWAVGGGGGGAGRVCVLVRRAAQQGRQAACCVASVRGV